MEKQSVARSLARRGCLHQDLSVLGCRGGRPERPVNLSRVDPTWVWLHRPTVELQLVLTSTGRLPAVTGVRIRGLRTAAPPRDKLLVSKGALGLASQLGVFQTPFPAAKLSSQALPATAVSITFSRKRYLKGWFLLDVISSLPVALVSHLVNGTVDRYLLGLKLVRRRLLMLRRPSCGLSLSWLE